MDFVTLTEDEAKAVRKYMAFELFDAEDLLSAARKCGSTTEELFWL